MDHLFKLFEPEQFFLKVNKMFFNVVYIQVIQTNIIWCLPSWLEEGSLSNVWISKVCYVILSRYLKQENDEFCKFDNSSQRTIVLIWDWKVKAGSSTFKITAEAEAEGEEVDLLRCSSLGSSAKRFFLSYFVLFSSSHLSAAWLVIICIWSCGFPLAVS